MKSSWSLHSFVSFAWSSASGLDHLCSTELTLLPFFFSSLHVNFSEQTSLKLILESFFEAIGMHTAPLLIGSAILWQDFVEFCFVPSHLWWESNLKLKLNGNLLQTCVLLEACLNWTNFKKMWLVSPFAVGPSILNLL